MHRWYHFRLAGDYDGKYVQLIIVLVQGDVDFTAAFASLGPHSSRLRHGPFMDPIISLFKDTSPWQQYSIKNVPPGFNCLTAEGNAMSKGKNAMLAVIVYVHYRSWN